MSIHRGRWVRENFEGDEIGKGSGVDAWDVASGVDVVEVDDVDDLDYAVDEDVIGIEGDTSEGKEDAWSLLLQPRRLEGSLFKSTLAIWYILTLGMAMLSFPMYWNCLRRCPSRGGQADVCWLVGPRD